MSNTKLGLLVFWPTFWTGFPVKMLICLLLLAGGLHPWSGLGLEFLLVLSIPIDIWALGVCARTVFLERLNRDPQPGIGLRMWWKWAIFTVVAFVVGGFALKGVTSVAKAMSHGIVEIINEYIWHLPVAEHISVDLVLWGSVASGALIILLIAWLWGLGAIAQREVEASTSKEGSFGEIVHFWDLLRVPSDQTLLLTAFTGAGVALVFLFWGMLPETTPHPHDEYEYTNVVKIEPPVKPLEVLKNTETILKKAELAIIELEKEQGTQEGEGGAKPEPESAAKPANDEPAAKSGS